MKRTVCVFFVLLGSTTGLYAGTMPSTVYDSLNIRVTTPFDLGRAYGERFVETQLLIRFISRLSASNYREHAA